MRGAVGGTTGPAFGGGANGFSTAASSSRNGLARPAGAVRANGLSGGPDASRSARNGLAGVVVAPPGVDAGGAAVVSQSRRAAFEPRASSSQ